MKSFDLVIPVLQWLGDHILEVGLLLFMATPVLSVCVAGYALHVIDRALEKRKK